MASLWATLGPLMIGSAFVPVQLIITILLLRSTAGKVTAVAWVSGMTAVRVVQGLVFGLVLGSADEEAGAEGSGGGSPVASTLLLVVALMFLITAVRKLLADDEEDGAPPKWLSGVESMGPAKAFVLGAGLMLIGAKFWVFTLSAVSAILDAELSTTSGVLAFLTFVVLGASVHIALIVVAYLRPERAEVLLARSSDWLSEHNRVIMIVIGFVFGTWFLVKALDGLGVI